MVKIEINGIEIEARDGAMVIEAADEADIPIPRFCYHKKLSVAANCRMCLVEVEKAAKPLPACATPVTDGMKVYTKSPKAIEAQKGVMEFLLINHPLDCPICDQGGECDLQDLAMGYGASHSRFLEKKRVVKDENLGSLIATDMTRCIHCTRCIRFGDEIAGIKELGATGRGEHLEIGTYVAHTLESELSGNIIDLCPVGALTSKPFRYSARSWEITSSPSIAPHDCIGSNIELHVRRNTVMRVVPRENEVINETWLSDRDRFSYEGLNSEDRLTDPMIKKDGKWEKVAWDVALEFAANGLKGLVQSQGAEKLGALVSPSATVEELYLLQKLLRDMGSANIDHRLRQQDFSDQDHEPLFPWLGQSVEDLEQVDAALLIGANIRKEQPIAGLRLRKAALAGGKVMFINPVDYPISFPVAEKIITKPSGMEQAIAGVAKVLLKNAKSKAPQGVAKLLAGVAVDETHHAMAQHLKTADNASIFLGLGAINHPGFSTLRALAGVVAELSGARLGYFSSGSNSSGAYMAGALPHRGPGGKGKSDGLSVRAMFEQGLKGYILMGIEPEFDIVEPTVALHSLDSADIVVSLSSYFTDVMASYADVILPIVPFSETSGTFVNIEGRWQSFAAAASPRGNARPGWKVVRVMGNLLGLAGFDYISSEDVREECHALLKEQHGDNKMSWQCPSDLTLGVDTLVAMTDIPAYGVDCIVRRATALQLTPDAISQGSIKIGHAVAARLGLEDSDHVIAKQGESEATIPLVVDKSVPDGLAILPSAVAGAKNLSSGSIPIELRQP